MLVLVDGHNALYALNLWSGSHRDSRMRLLERVKAVRPRAVVYFDAQESPGDLVSIGGEAGMRVIYCSRQEADTEMVERISNAVHPSQVLVVTNDVHLGRRVKALGARVTQIRPFLDRKPEEVDDKAGAPVTLYRAEDFDLPDEIDLDAPPADLL